MSLNLKLPSKLKILVIDDDLVDCENYQRIFRKRSQLNIENPITVCHTAESGLEQLKNLKFDILLLDYQLPDCSGIELLRKIHELHENFFLNTSTIILTSHGDEESAIQAIKLGAVDYIYKNELNPSRLTTSIELALEKKILSQNLKNQTRKSDYLKTHDSLTQLLNRHSFNEELAKYLKKDDTPFSLICFDINAFNTLNVFHGHSKGDEILIKLSSILKRNLKKNDVAGRVGADEFTVIFNGTDLENETAHFVDKIIEEFAQSRTTQLLNLSLSSGIYIHNFEENNLDISEILQRTDDAKIQAKKRGGNEYCYFNPKHQTRVRKMIQFENQIKEAVKNKEFTLFYQPIYQIINGKEVVQGFEGLMRCTREEIKNSSPVAFIPILEELKLINKLTSWLLEKSFQDYRLISNKYLNMDYGLSINMSPSEIIEEVSLEKLTKLSANFGFELPKLTLELTETDIMELSEKNIKKILSLKSSGIHIALDDFGTGYSSLLKLSQLPIDTIKIDKCFISGISKDSINLNLVESIIDIAHKLDARAVIEGVESEQEFHVLEKVTSRTSVFYQGYYFGKPMSLDTILQKN